MSSKSCSLCLQQRELRESHYIPKGVFKAVGHGGPNYESQNVSLNFQTGTVSYSNFQPTQKLLCSDCEQKFSDRGEDLVIPELLTHNDFPLRDKTLSLVSDDSVVTRKTMGKLDYQRYAYFALSVIWRGSTTQWPAPYNKLYGKLRRHEELFRRYLYDQKQFPHRTFITVYVDTVDQNYHGLHIPYFHSEIYEKTRLRVFKFQVPGVIFNVFTEANIPVDQKITLSEFPIPISFIKIDFSQLNSYRNAIEQAKNNRPIGKKMLKEHQYLMRDRGS